MDIHLIQYMSQNHGFSLHNHQLMFFFVSKLIRYARASSLHENLILRSRLWTSKLLIPRAGYCILVMDLYLELDGL